MTSSQPLPGTAMGDVYSFGVIIQEVTLQDEPFAEKQLQAEEIVQKIKEGDRSMKPEIPDSNYMTPFIKIKLKRAMFIVID